MKKYWKEILLCMIIILIIVPMGIAFMFQFKFILTESSSGWIGFWGSYLGAIFGGLITLFVMFKTLKENKESQKKGHRIDFCNDIWRMSGEICGAINKECIYLRKFVDDEFGGNMDDIYNALMARSKINELFHICTTQLISKIHDKDYMGVEKLMDKIEELMISEHSINIAFDYTVDERRQTEAACDKVLPMISEMRDWMVEFMEDNCR